MAERMLQRKVWTRFERVLKNAAVAEAGQVACLDTSDGALVPASVATTLVPIGLFETSLTGDGTKTVFVQVFAPIDITEFVNSATGPVDDGDVGSLCYLHSASSEVSMTATGKSVAGRVWGISGSGAGAIIYVQAALTP